MPPNTRLDKEFKKDIQVVKQKADQGFITALNRFKYCWLQNQKIKL